METEEHWCSSTSPVVQRFGTPTGDGGVQINHVRHADGSICINPAVTANLKPLTIRPPRISREA